MKIADIAEARVTIELDCTDCLALADACAWATCKDLPGDSSLVQALGAMFTAAALAAFAVEHGNGDAEGAYTLEELRRLRVPYDSRPIVPSRVVDLFED